MCLLVAVVLKLIGYFLGIFIPSKTYDDTQEKMRGRHFLNIKELNVFSVKYYDVKGS